MKIGIISNLYPPIIRGGAEVVAQTMAEGLHDNLQHVFVITTRPFTSLRSLLPELIMINRVPVYRFYPLNLYYYIFDFKFIAVIRAAWHVLDIFNVHSYFVIKQILLTEKPNVVITHNLTGIGFLVPRLLARLRIKHVHVLHDVQLYAPSGIILKGHENNFQQKIISALGYPRLMRFLFAKSSLIVSPSQFLMDFYMKRGFFNGVASEILPNPVRIHSSQVHARPVEALRIMYLGQVTKAKGIVDFVEIFCEMINLPITLKIVGTGPELENLKQRTSADSRITFYGWRSTQEIAEMFGASDVLVVPTLCYDNSPTVVFEALSYGVPVIASNIGGAQEIIKHGHNGWIFDPLNRQNVKKLLASLSRERTQVVKAAEQAQGSVSHLTVTRYIDELLTGLRI